MFPPSFEPSPLAETVHELPIGIPAHIVEEILEGAGVFDEVLEEALRSALLKVPFAVLSGFSNESSMEPSVLIRLLSLLIPEKGKKYLIVGVENGLAPAVLSLLGASVFCIEPEGSVAQKVQKWLDHHSLSSSLTTVRPIEYGWDEYQPYDGMLMTGLPATIPAPLFAQLVESSPAGPAGRIVCLVGDTFTQTVTVFHKKELVVKRHDFEIVQGYK